MIRRSPGLVPTDPPRGEGSPPPDLSIHCQAPVRPQMPPSPAMQVKGRKDLSKGAGGCSPPLACCTPAPWTHHSVHRLDAGTQRAGMTGAALEHQRHGLQPGPCLGVGRAPPTPQGSFGTWALGFTIFFPACPKEPSPHGALPNHLLRRVRGGRAAQDPSAADHMSEERSAASARCHQPLLRRWALALPTRASSTAPRVPPRGDAGARFLGGNVSPL